MSVIPDDDLERLARLLMGNGETDRIKPKIVRLLQTDDDICRAPELRRNKPSIH
jgi:hypothetical protein